MIRPAQYTTCATEFNKTCEFRNFTEYDNKCFANLPQQKIWLTKYTVQQIISSNPENNL